jgi:hypothetical protein
MRKARVGLFLLCLAACSHPQPPPLQSFKLEAYQANYRDPAAPKSSVCGAEPKALAKELSGMGDLLSAFLESTSAPSDGAWSEDHLALLKASQDSLGKVLDTYQAELFGVVKCKFDKKLGIDELVQKSEELVGQARKRIDEAPGLLAAVEARAATKKWHDGLPGEEESAKGQWCPPSPRPGSSDVYFAFKDESGHAEWLFCDGSKVKAEASGAPEWIPGAAAEEKVSKKKKKAKAPTPKPYLEAAAKYPAKEIHQAPSGAPAADKPKADEKEKSAESSAPTGQ